MTLPPSDCKTIQDALKHENFCQKDKATLLSIAKNVKEDPECMMCHAGFIVKNKNYIYKVEKNEVINCVKIMDASRFAHIRR